MARRRGTRLFSGLRLGPFGGFMAGKRRTFRTQFAGSGTRAIEFVDASLKPLTHSVEPAHRVCQSFED